jgi:hypothetical protein
MCLYPAWGEVGIGQIRLGKAGEIVADADRAQSDFALRMRFDEVPTVVVRYGITNASPARQASQIPHIAQPSTRFW